MKTTFDLPSDLVREIKLQAVDEGRNLEDVIVDLLRKGLGLSSSSRTAIDGRKVAVKLPLFAVAKNAPASRMSAAELTALEHETLSREDLERIRCLL